MNRSVLPLAVRLKEAAAMLGVCPRTLWSLTAPRGPIPCVRPNGEKQKALVLYRVADLDAWLSRQSQSRAPAENEEGGAK